MGDRELGHLFFHLIKIFCLAFFILLPQVLWAQFSFDSNKIWAQLREARAQSEQVSQRNLSAIDAVSAETEEQRRHCEVDIANNLLKVVQKSCTDPLLESGSVLRNVVYSKRQVPANLGLQFKRLTEGLSQNRVTPKIFCTISSQLYRFRTDLLKHNEELKAQESIVYSQVEKLLGPECEQPYLDTVNQIREGAWRLCTKEVIDREVSTYSEEMTILVTEEVNRNAGEPYIASRKLRQELVFLANEIDKQILQIHNHLEALKTSCGEHLEVASR